MRLINRVVELCDCLQILICLGSEGKDNTDYLDNEYKAYTILKEQYGAFSLYFEEIRQTIDVENLYRIMGDFMNNENFCKSGDVVLLVLQWFNVYGYNGYGDTSKMGDEVQQEQTNEPQQTKTISQGKGRPKKCFKDYMINDPDGSKLQKIHALMDGQKGKGAALIILACIKIGWITRPTHKVVADEFGVIGVQQGFTRYLKDSMFTKDELEGAINSLK